MILSPSLRLCTEISLSIFNNPSRHALPKVFPSCALDLLAPMDWYRLSSLLLTLWYLTPTQILLGLLEFTPFSLQYTSLFLEIDCHSSECFKKLFLIICLTRKLCHENLCITPCFLNTWWALWGMTVLDLVLSSTTPDLLCTNCGPISLWLAWNSVYTLRVQVWVQPFYFSTFYFTLFDFYLFLRFICEKFLESNTFILKWKSR